MTDRALSLVDLSFAQKCQRNLVFHSFLTSVFTFFVLGATDSLGFQSGERPSLHGIAHSLHADAPRFTLCISRQDWEKLLSEILEMLPIGVENNEVEGLAV